MGRAILKAVDDCGRDGELYWDRRIRITDVFLGVGRLALDFTVQLEVSAVHVGQLYWALINQPSVPLYYVRPFLRDEQE